MEFLQQFRADVPHDDVDKSHDNLTEAVEEVGHGLGFFSHVTHDDTECTAESNDTCNNKQVLEK